MNKTGIEYLTHTWNPISGCAPISRGCANCWAKRRAEEQLRGKFGYDQKDPFQITFHPARLDQPRRKTKPAIIGVCFMGDMFHEKVPDQWIASVFDEIRHCGCPGQAGHKFLILTKRPQRMVDVLHRLRFSNEGIGKVWMGKRWGLDDGEVFLAPLIRDYCWFGVSAEDQEAYDYRVPELLKLNKIGNYSYHLFVSLEPLLSPIRLHLASKCDKNCGEYQNAECPGTSGLCVMQQTLPWVIAGAETGPNARECRVEWAADIAAQCAAANVPFFWKRFADDSTTINGEIYRQAPENLGVYFHPDQYIDWKMYVQKENFDAAKFKKAEGK